MSEKYKDTIKRVKPIVEEFRRKMGISYPIAHSLHTASVLGYYIIKAPAPQNLSGFYMKKDKYPFIFVNTAHSLGRQNFSLWHEVYHHYMNHENGISDFNSKSIEEREAEIFAGCLILPDDELDVIAEDEITPELVARISHRFQISFNAAAVRFMQENYISYDEFKEFQKLSTWENAEKLKSMYTELSIPTDILEPTKDIRISPNIMDILQKNYKNNKLKHSAVDDIIQRIEGLNHAK